MKKKTIHDSIKTKKNVDIIISDNDEITNNKNDENWIVKKTYEKNENEKKTKKQKNKKKRKKNEKNDEKKKSKMNVKPHNLLKSDIKL